MRSHYYFAITVILAFGLTATIIVSPQPFSELVQVAIFFMSIGVAVAGTLTYFESVKDK